MKDVTYPYDRELYNRSFLNCYQRQSVVMLAERTPQVHQLFYPCLISTDDILEQAVRGQQPKYDFRSRFFDPGDFSPLGVRRVETAVEGYREARPLLLDTVREQGSAILVVDVCYLPHCPEHRVRHVTHTIVLRAYDPAAREWSILDDNRAGVLCQYRYGEDVIAAACDNSVLRAVRHFPAREPDGAVLETARAFAELLDRHEDSHTLLTSVQEILADPWVAQSRSIAALHDALSLYQGSRACLREYLARTVGDPTVDECLRLLVRRSADLQGRLLLGTVTGTVDAPRLAAAGQELAAADRDLVDRLRALHRAA